MAGTLEELYAKLDLDTTKLAHFGIKGMKWGIRRSDAQLARARGTASNDSVDAVRARETLAKIQSTGSLSSVSDADLNHLTNRLNTEKRYADIQESIGKTAKLDAKTKKYLGYGNTLNDVIKFVNSPAGKLLSASLGKSKGKHAMSVSDQITRLNQGKKKK